MATFVFVHGGGHGGWCWQPVARQLRAMGHEVHTPSLDTGHDLMLTEPDLVSRLLLEIAALGT